MQNQPDFSRMTPRFAVSERQGGVAPLRPRNEKMDALVKKIHSSEAFSLSNSHAVLMTALKGARASA